MVEDTVGPRVMHDCDDGLGEISEGDPFVNQDRQRSGTFTVSELLFWIQIRAWPKLVKLPEKFPRLS
jgi:hypothetical protein